MTMEIVTAAINTDNWNGGSSDEAWTEKIK